jgi:hypothetical protein
MKKLLLALILISPAVLAEPIARVEWNYTGTQTDGTVVPLDALSFTVYDEYNMVRCATRANSCDIQLAWSECITVHATVTQDVVGLESAPSDSVNVCALPKPNLPMTSPVIMVRIVGL